MPDVITQIRCRFWSSPSLSEFQARTSTGTSITNESVALMPHMWFLQITKRFLNMKNWMLFCYLIPLLDFHYFRLLMSLKTIHPGASWHRFYLRQGVLYQRPLYALSSPNQIKISSIRYIQDLGTTISSFTPISPASGMESFPPQVDFSTILVCPMQLQNMFCRRVNRSWCKSLLFAIFILAKRCVRWLYKC